MGGGFGSPACTLIYFSVVGKGAGVSFQLLGSPTRRGHLLNTGGIDGNGEDDRMEWIYGLWSKFGM